MYRIDEDRRLLSMGTSWLRPITWFLISLCLAVLAAGGLSWSTITGLLAGGFALLAGMWWCARQYYRIRAKGYRPVPAATITIGGNVIGALGALSALDALLRGWTWPDAGKNAVISLISR